MKRGRRYGQRYLSDGMIRTNTKNGCVRKNEHKDATV